MSGKIGEFDWIASFVEIDEYLEICCKCLKSSSIDIHVLEIGCGTSSMSELIARQYRKQDNSDLAVISVTASDYDSDCVAHLKSKYSQTTRENDANITEVNYCVYDVVTGEGELDHKQYSLVVDKGTLDAILVEGSIASMLANIHKLLCNNGLYLIISIHSVEQLSALLEIPELGFTVIKAEQLKRGNGSAVICKKIDIENGFDADAYLEHEHIVMDKLYKDEQPLLTSEREAQIRQAFAAALKDSNRKTISLQEAHKIMFQSTHDTNELLLGYDYSLFLEDLQQFPLQNAQEMTLEEMIAFLQQMQ